MLDPTPTDSLRRAKKLSEVPAGMRVRPLRAAELGDFFVDTADVRDMNCDRRESIAHALEEDPLAKVLFFGHRGSGKSTELVQLRKENFSRYAFVSFSLVMESATSNLRVESLLLLIVEAMVRAVTTGLREGNGSPLRLNDKNLEKAREWFAKVVQVSETVSESSVEGTAAAEVGSNFFGIFRSTAGVKAELRAGVSSIETAVKEQPRRLSELSAHCNALVREIRTAVLERQKRDLLLVVEDMDKLTLESADLILVQNPAPLTNLECRAIYTAPLWLLCNPRAAEMERLFRRVTLPMIRVATPSGTDDSAGFRILRQIVERRMDLALFDPAVSLDAEPGEGPLDLAIRKTGGVMRHLFEVIEIAAEAAHHAVRRGRRTEQRILREDVVYGLGRKKIDLVHQIGTVGLPESYRDKVTVDEMIRRLADLAGKPRRLDSDPVTLLLLQSASVLEYNGVGWHGVHPLVKEHLYESHPDLMKDVAT